MKHKYFIVMRKELAEALRDRRAIGVFLLFVVLYPFLLFILLHKLIDTTPGKEHEDLKIVMIGSAQTPTLLAMLQQKNIQVTPHADMSDADITELLRRHDFTAVIKVSNNFTDNYTAMRPARIELWYDSASQLGSKLRRIENVLNMYNNNIAGARLLAHGVSPAVLTPIRLQPYDVATNASRSVQFLGALLGMFFAASFFFCLNTAMDATAGERERRSLEALLTLPIRPFDVIAGKWLATAALAMAGLTLELVAAHVILKWMPLEEIGMSWRMSLPMLCAMIATAMPLCLFAAAFEIALAMNAKTFKEAQTMMSFAVLLPMLPAIVVPIMDVHTSLWMYAVPVLANQTLLLEVAKGQAVGWLPFLLTGASSLLAAALAVLFAAWRLRSERYILGV